MGIQLKPNCWVLNRILSVLVVCCLCYIIAPFSKSWCQNDNAISIQEQIESYQKQLAADPTRVDIRLQLGKIYLQIEGYAQALSEYREVISVIATMQKHISALPDGYFGVGLSYVGLEKFNEAIEAFLQAIKYAPQRAHIHAALGSAYTSLHQYDEALKTYKNANKLLPDDAMIHHQLGNIYSKRGNRSSAILHHQKAIEILPNLATAHYQLGILYTQENRLDDAISAYETAYNKDSDLIEALYNLAQTHNRNGNRQAAREKMRLFDKRKEVVEPIQELRGALQRTNDPIKRSRIVANIGRHYLKGEQYEKAKLEYEKSIALNPKVAEAYNGVGIAYAMLERYTDAIAAQKQALKLQPEFAEAHAGLGLVYLSENKDDLALKHYRQALKLSQNRGETRKIKFEEEVLLKIGNILLNHNEYPEAISSYQAVLSLNPNSAEAYHNLGVCYARQQKTHDALSALQKAVDISESLPNKPTDIDTTPSKPYFLPETYYLLGELYMLQKNSTKAESAYLASGLAKAYNALAQHGAKHADTFNNSTKRKEQLKTAKSYAENAIQLDPNSASFHNTLALITYRIGDYSTAETSIRKAIALDPKNRNYQEGLKQILTKLAPQ